MSNCGTRNTGMNFILPHSFYLEFARGTILSTLVELLFNYSNEILRNFIIFMKDHLRRIYLNAKGSNYDRLSISSY